MATYRVKVVSPYVEIFEIEAENEMDALTGVYAGEGVLADSYPVEDSEITEVWEEKND